MNGLHEPQWQSVPKQISLGAGEAHIWKASLQADQEQLIASKQLLSADECERADHFVFEHHQRRFTTARATLRRILQRYVQHPAHELTFDYGEKGKPALASVMNAIDLQFSVSHSHELALYVVAREQPVGIDIEYMDKQHDMGRIVERFFTAIEREQYAQAQVHLKSEIFYAIWTCKEAYIKTTGQGLYTALQSFDVQLGSPNTAIVIDHAKKHHASEQTLQRFIPEFSYRAACNKLPSRFIAVEL